MRRATTRLEQHGHAIDWCERVGHAPRQNPPREVVDDGVQIGACAVEQTDNGGVDVPHLVRSCRAEPHLRLRGMHTDSRASPPYWRTRRYQVDGAAATR